ncbi:hypothetical protein HU200_041410 [Digitaria exilis]|uniref:Uncharacterized protein n=1 Tax=Digitaria exilis TaxID=1010633 RepID=A0A835B4J2_9POAL|nr:hypothetical protein HU200_041410 [Digitaria exilis]
MTGSWSWLGKETTGQQKECARWPFLLSGQFGASVMHGSSTHKRSLFRGSWKKSMILHDYGAMRVQNIWLL